jgi:hypothetical protein
MGDCVVVAQDRNSGDARYDLLGNSKRLLGGAAPAI